MDVDKFFLHPLSFDLIKNNKQLWWLHYGLYSIISDVTLVHYVSFALTSTIW